LSLDPKWADMPEPHPLLTLSWEDILEKAERCGKTLTREEVIEVFDRVVSSEMDYIMDGFSELLTVNIDRVRPLRMEAGS